MPVQRLPSNQEDREVYLRDIHAEMVVDTLKDGHIVEITPDSTWLPDDLYVAISYARAEGANVTIQMIPREMAQNVNE